MYLRVVVNLVDVSVLLTVVNSVMVVSSLVPIFGNDVSLLPVTLGSLVIVVSLPSLSVAKTIYNNVKNKSNNTNY